MSSPEEPSAPEDPGPEERATRTESPPQSPSDSPAKLPTREVFLSGPLWKALERISNFEGAASVSEWLDLPVLNTLFRYGWILCLPVGVLFWWINKQSELNISPDTANRVRLALFSAVSLACGFVLAANLSAPRYSGLGDTSPYSAYIGSWGPYGAKQRLRVTAKGKYLQSKREDYSLAAVAFHYYGDADIKDVYRLQKSGLHDIEDRNIPIAILLDDEFMKKVATGTRRTQYVLLLVPKGTTMEQFSTLRQAEGLGVIFVQKVGGPP